MSHHRVINPTLIIHGTRAAEEMRAVAERELASKRQHVNAVPATNLSLVAMNAILLGPVYRENEALWEIEELIRGNLARIVRQDGLLGRRLQVALKILDDRRAKAQKDTPLESQPKQDTTEATQCEEKGGPNG